MTRASGIGEETSGMKSPADTQLLVSQWLMAFPPNTRTTYRHAIGELADHLDSDLLEAKRPDIQRWLMHLTETAGLAPATVRKKTSAVSSFFDYAVEQKHIDHNPCEHVRRPQGDSAPRRGLDINQAHKLIDTAADHSRTAHALVWLMAGAGLRVSEACSARIENLDQEQQLITVKVKRGDRQTKPLSPPVMSAVLAQVSDRTEGPILTNAEGNRLTRQRAWELIERLTGTAGITDCTPHTLRHTAATIALEAGVPVQDVQQLLGHKSIETTLRYIRSRDILGATRSAADRLASALSDGRYNTNYAEDT